jgi:hypothetical protein
MNKMETEQLNQMYEAQERAQEKALMRFRKYKPFRTVEVESRAKARQIVRIAKDIADLVLDEPVQSNKEPLQLPEKDYTQPSTYLPFAELAYKVA